MPEIFDGHIPLDDCGESVVPDYALLFFDHLYSEYLVLRSEIGNPAALDLLESIHQKRMNCRLTWSDIYTFDLSLVDQRPTENLIRKAYDARIKYRTIAGQKEYDEYVASNPPNLIEIKVEPNANPAQPTDAIKNNLRADLQYLLSKFYLYYAVLPARESLRDDLTRRAVGRTMIFVGVLSFFILLNVVAVFGLNRGDAPSGFTVLTVVLAGIIGGCVSMLQRIQSTPSEGDALFNLAGLNNGWRGLSLSPLYGGIFASLLFILFAAGILRGSVFPRIETSRSLQSSAETRPSPTPLPAVTPSPLPSLIPSSLTGTASPPATVTPAPTTVRGAEVDVLRIRSFLKQTGPADGVSYSLLIIWSFLAGFAERLVPDTLNRLVAKNDAIQGK